MPSAIQRRKSADPIRVIQSEIATCQKELTKARREVQRLEEKLQSLLTKHLEAVGRMK